MTARTRVRRAPVLTLAVGLVVQLACGRPADATPDAADATRHRAPVTLRLGTTELLTGMLSASLSPRQLVPVMKSMVRDVAPALGWTPASRAV